MKMTHPELLAIAKKALGMPPRLDARDNLADLIRSKGTSIFLNYDWIPDKRFYPWAGEIPGLETDYHPHGVTLEVKEEVRIIIAGSRSITDLMHIDDAVEASKFHITEVVSGGANGVDLLGEAWAKNHEVPVKHFLPDWNIGRHAGHLRNEDMGRYADGLIAVWDGESKGTAHMIKYMKYMCRPVFVHTVG